MQITKKSSFDLNISSEQMESLRTIIIHFLDSENYSKYSENTRNFASELFNNFPDDLT